MELRDLVRALKQQIHPALSLNLGGEPLPVLFAGAQGELVGVDQINAQLPRSLMGRGVVNIELQVGGQTANVVTIRMQ